MRKLALSVALISLGLVGCATNNDYRLYADTQAKIAQAQAQAEAMKETARYAALAEIAKTGDPAARVAAVMSINMGAQASAGPRPVPLNPPRNWSDTALQWTGVLLPSLTNLYGISSNRQVAITQSNNSAAVAASTNAAFASVANSGFTATTNIANSGFTATTNIANSGFTAVNNVAGQIKPNITITGNSGSSINAGNTGTSSTGAVTWQPLSGSGVIGSGSYTNDASNRPATTTSTSTSTTTTTNQCGSNASGGTVTCP